MMAIPVAIKTAIRGSAFLRYLANSRSTGVSNQLKREELLGTAVARR